MEVSKLELQQLQKHITKQLQLPKSMQLIETSTFSIPIQIVQVTYAPIRRVTMDILMKMMLKAFQTGHFHDAETVAEVLLVEQLFIEDLLQKMMKTNLVEMNSPVTLTLKGQEQLASGIFEEQAEERTTELYYSAVHQAFLEGEFEEFDEFPDELSAAQHIDNSWQKEQIIDMLGQLLESTAEDPLFVTAIEQAEPLQIIDSPCFLFVLQHAEKETEDIRIFNTFTNEWDPQLEQFVKETGR